MDIEFKGGNCVVIDAKKTSIVVDPKLDDFGFKNQDEKAAVQVLTQPAFGVTSPSAGDKLIIDGPGEYEVNDVSITGIAALAHIDPKGSSLNATIYRIEAGDISLAVLGHVHPDLSEEQLEHLGVVDILVVPVGGNGYTLDATGATKLIKAIEPKIVVPTSYDDPNAKYPVPQADLSVFLKETGVSSEKVNKLKIKPGSLGESLSVVEITRTS